MNQNTRKTHCKNGHEFTEENTYVKGTHRVCRSCCRVASLKRDRADKKDPIRSVKRQQRRRKAQLKKVGWTPDLFSSTLLEQEEKCAICKKKLQLNIGQEEGRACADHKHTIPPKPRGILCPQCNVGIGNLQDDPEILMAAAAYIQKYLGEG